MFTWTQYSLGEPLIWGVLSDILFWGALWVGYRRKKSN